MNPIPQKFFYRTKYEIDDFTEGPDSYLFDKIYDHMNALKAPHYDRLDEEVDLLLILNQACALATKVWMEKHPEQNFRADYVQTINVKWRGEVWYVLSILYFIVAAQSMQSKKFKYVLNAIECEIGTNEGYFKPTKAAVAEFIKQRDADGVTVNSQFIPRPEGWLNYDDLYNFTYFRKHRILDLLNYCTRTKEDRLQLLHSIETAYGMCDDENNGIDPLPF